MAVTIRSIIRTVMNNSKRTGCKSSAHALRGSDTIKGTLFGIDGVMRYDFVSLRYAWERILKAPVTVEAQAPGDLFLVLSYHTRPGGQPRRCRSCPSLKSIISPERRSSYSLRMAEPCSATACLRCQNSRRVPISGLATNSITAEATGRRSRDG